MTSPSTGAWLDTTPTANLGGSGRGELTWPSQGGSAGGRPRSRSVDEVPRVPLIRTLSSQAPSSAPSNYEHKDLEYDNPNGPRLSITAPSLSSRWGRSSSESTSISDPIENSPPKTHKSSAGLMGSFRLPFNLPFSTSSTAVSYSPLPAPSSSATSVPSPPQSNRDCLRVISHEVSQRLAALVVALRSGRLPWLRIVVGLLIAFVLLEVALHIREIKGFVFAVLTYIDQHKGQGAFLFILFFGIATTLLIPATFPTIAAGIIFRPLWFSVIVVLLGSQLALVLSVTAGRTWLRPFVENRVVNDPRFRAIDHAITVEGWKIVILLRLAPIIPFGVINYLVSMTSIDLVRVLMPATLVGNTPGAVLNSFIGSIVGTLAGAEDYKMDPRTRWILILFGGTILSTSVSYITAVSRRALRYALAHSPRDEKEDDSVTDAIVDDSEDSMVVVVDGDRPRRRARTSSAESSPDRIDESTHAVGRVLMKDESDDEDDEERETMRNPGDEEGLLATSPRSRSRGKSRSYRGNPSTNRGNDKIPSTHSTRGVRPSASAMSLHSLKFWWAKNNNDRGDDGESAVNPLNNTEQGALLQNDGALGDGDGTDVSVDGAAIDRVDTEDVIVIVEDEADRSIGNRGGKSRPRGSGMGIETTGAQANVPPVQQFDDVERRMIQMTAVGCACALVFGLPAILMFT
ncbi:hypothetical protein HK102_010678 [Quaeritorhiza haematococci]|nr:hypothetical protein HK102_010678 [Quaeritorhiza haematococci]